MSEYNHDRDWEISPEERSEQRQQRLGPPTGTRPRTDGQRAQFQRRDRRPPRDRARPEDDDQDQDQGDPGLLGQLLHAIFAPFIGFLSIAIVSLLWSGFLFGALMVYTNLGNELTITALGISMAVWIFGMDVFYKTILTP